MDANAIHDICFCSDHKWQHSASKRCQAGKLAESLNINMQLASWLASKYQTAEKGAEAVKHSTEEHTCKMLLRHKYITEAEYKDRRDRALEVLYREGIISESEYLRRTHPDPTLTFDELMAADWSPSELNF